MSQLPTLANLSAFDGSGVEQPPAAATGYVTLTASDVYYFPLPFSEAADVLEVQLLTGAAIAGSFYIEVTNVPRKKHPGVGPVDATDYNETAGVWVKLDPSTAYVPTVGSGWTVTNATAVKTAAAGGSAIWTLSLFGSARARLAASVTTTGTARVVTNSKGRV
jgi:hypothetical protein